MTDHMQTCLTVADHLISLLIFYPICCCFWRGSWDLCGFYILPGRVPLCYWVMAAIGSCTLINYFIIPCLDRTLNRNNILYVPLSRLFLYYHAVLFMALWRGVWELYNYYLGKDWRWSLLHLCGSLALLILFKVLRSTVWPPLLISVDTHPNLLRASTLFKTNPSKKLLYMGDCFISALAIPCLTMLSWRSAWNVMDHVIFPANYLESNIVCLTCGTTGILILFTCQSRLSQVSQKLNNSSPLARLAWEDAWYLVSFCFLTLMWRGGWNLNTTYLISQLPLGAWVNHLAGACLMLVSQTFSCMAAFGVAIDGDASPTSAFFANEYLRYYLNTSSDHEPNLTAYEASITDDYEDPSTNERTPILGHLTAEGRPSQYTEEYTSQNLNIQFPVDESGTVSPPK